MGQHNPFDFGLHYEAAPGLRHFLTGTPPVLSVLLSTKIVRRIFRPIIEPKPKWLFVPTDPRPVA